MGGSVKLMKRFTEFLVEANKTGAAKEAMQKGLVYDRQKAGWINPVNGELIARTEKGKLLHDTQREEAGATTTDV